jgi:hypothetical protein
MRNTLTHRHKGLAASMRTCFNLVKKIIMFSCLLPAAVFLDLTNSSSYAQTQPQRIFTSSVGYSQDAQDINAAISEETDLNETKCECVISSLCGSGAPFGVLILCKNNRKVLIEHKLNVIDFIKKYCGRSYSSSHPFNLDDMEYLCSGYLQNSIGAKISLAIRRLDEIIVSVEENDLRCTALIPGGTNCE